MEQVAGYRVLWELAETFYKRAGHIAAQATSSNKQSVIQRAAAESEIARCVQAAISSLQVILTQQPPRPRDVWQNYIYQGTLSSESLVPPPLVLIQTRLRLAHMLMEWTENDQEIESNFQKALLLAEKLDTCLYFDIQCMQLRYYNSKGMNKAGKALLKTLESETRQLNDPLWLYKVALFQLEYCYTYSDITGLFSVYKKVANYPPGPIHNVFLLLKLHTCLLLRDDQQASQVVETLKQSTLDPALSLYLELNEMILLTHKGNNVPAIALVKKVQQTLEHATSHTESLFPPSLCVPFEKGQLQFTMPSQQQVVGLVYLISGLVYKPSDTVKAKKFITEGLKWVNKQLSSKENCTSYETVIQEREWYSELKTILMRHYVELCLLRSDFDEGYKCLTSLVTYLSHKVVLWNRYQFLVALLWGFLYQSLKMYEQAEEWYQIAYHQHNTQDIKDPIVQNELKEIRFMAFISLLLIQSHARQQEENNAMFRELDTFSQSNSSFTSLDRTKGLLSTVRGIASISHSEITMTKTHLLDTLKLCDGLMSCQLKYVCLTVLGRLFIDTAASQAEKMLVTAYNQIKKSNQHRFAVFCCKLLCLCFQTVNPNATEEEKRERQCKLEEYQKAEKEHAALESQVTARTLLLLQKQ